MKTYFDKLVAYYEANERKCDIAFFIGGFVFDILTLSAVDDILSVLQQLLYLSVVGAILYFDILHAQGLWAAPVGRGSKIWEVRHPIMHFLLGSLLSVYSLFFLKSASSFTALLFVIALVILMIGNELKTMQKQSDLKVVLFMICVVAFASLLSPVLIGFIGWVPFLFSVVISAAVIGGVWKLLHKRIADRAIVQRKWLVPSGATLLGFAIMYVMGWIPPVPLSVKNLGVYHSIEKRDGDYILQFEKTWWKFWQKDDSNFRAEPGDKIFIFVQVYSPGRFDDSVILHWFYNDPKQGWQSTDKIPMRVTGGREGGYRGFAVKQNFTPGEWRVSVETTDSREIGRHDFDVEMVEKNSSARAFESVAY